jgi:8-oxo-dGTP pyrophosphatase MutT (NUDIX family)
MWAPNRELLKDFTNTAPPRNAAVAAVILPGEELLLIKRTPDNSHHSGQISFPGGKADATDASLLETALREYREETGADSSELKLAGLLSPLYIPVSNFMVYPHVFFADPLPRFNPSTEEVETIFTVPFHVFISDKYRSEFVIEWKGIGYTIPCFRYKERIIWGATAMMISELAEVLR